MKKVSEIKGTDALDVLADILEPAVSIMADEEIRKLAGKNRIKCVAYAIKNHKEEIIEILARLDGEDPENYQVNIITLPVKVLEILNDKELRDFFESYVTEASGTSSTSATQNTEETGTK